MLKIRNDNTSLLTPLLRPFTLPYASHHDQDPQELLINIYTAALPLPVPLPVPLPAEPHQPLHADLMHDAFLPLIYCGRSVL